ncbi:MAG: hypothetical protein JWO56_671, partial [Acidobacteria bacterium]|nr:hypothetical protein [Acidobacteriota bacterium]
SQSEPSGYQKEFSAGEFANAGAFTVGVTKAEEAS